MGWGTYSPLKMVYVCIYLPHEKGYVGIYLALKRVWVWYIFTPEKGVGWVYIYPWPSLPLFPVCEVCTLSV